MRDFSAAYQNLMLRTFWKRKGHGRYILVIAYFPSLLREIKERLKYTLSKRAVLEGHLEAAISNTVTSPDSPSHMLGDPST